MTEWLGKAVRMSMLVGGFLSACLSGCGGQLILELSQNEEELCGGGCPEGQLCTSGGCQRIEVLEFCSPSKPDGECKQDGALCFEGVCYEQSELPPSCSPQTPGWCPPGQACVEGQCDVIADGERCGPDNPEGLCPDSQRCVEGACFDPTHIDCAVTRPDGYCPGEAQCVDGECESNIVNTCFPENPDGVCPAWRECIQGECRGPRPPKGCSPEEPFGFCPGSEVCVAGTCVPVDTDNACSPENPAGICPPDAACLDGTCVHIGPSERCGPQNQEGLCPAGAVCENGACVHGECGDDGWKCPPGQRCTGAACVPVACDLAHPNGTCADSDKSCDRGVCVDPGCVGGARNACGGCSELPQRPGDPCGECSDGQWVCDGLDALECVNADLQVKQYYTDQDEDGWGRENAEPLAACFPPSSKYAAKTGDCDDRERTVNPGAEEECNGRDDDCDDATDEAPESQDCADACCVQGLVCEDAECKIACEGVRCGSDESVCCDPGQICYADTCVAPGGECESTQNCPRDAFCDQIDGQTQKCLPKELLNDCQFVPPTGVFEPTTGCKWQAGDASVPTPERDDVVGTPVVINLTDDNGDGRTDERDIPDVVFLSYDLEGDWCCNVRGTIRIASGACNADGTMTTLASLCEEPECDVNGHNVGPAMNNDTGMAAGDLDRDGVPEIVTLGYFGGEPQGTVAWERVTTDGTEWRVLWENPDFPKWDYHTGGGALYSIANLEGDRYPEVVVGNVVLDGRDGSLKWDGLDPETNGNNAGARPGVGNNAFLGPSSAVGDVDLDGYQEVAAGNTLYSHTGEIEWSFSYPSRNSACNDDNGLPCDGFNAIANFDADRQGEVVIIRLGRVYILNHDGTLLWQTDIPWDDCTRSGNRANEGGPPTVADFDGDGRMEIATASSDYYMVADMDCEGSPLPDACASEGILWVAPNRDCSSRVTGSSVFDFEGDGAAEVVYADEENLFIFDGKTGNILKSFEHGSHTRIESPVIADADNDGNSEIIIAENASRGGEPGLEIWRDTLDNWVRTRRIWNQHGYHITNVLEDGTIPPRPQLNWLEPRLNNFRQNVQPDNLFNAPDLTIGAVTSEVVCPGVKVTLEAVNDGALSVAPGMDVLVQLSSSESTLTRRVSTTSRLFPEDTETLEVVFDNVRSLSYSLDVTIDPDAAANECKEDNNTADTTTVNVSCGG
mgnify:CR=1 FL=1